MLHFSFGLVWLTLALSLLFFSKAVQARGQDVGMLATVATILSVYNFLRCGMTWLRRRRRDRADEHRDE